MRVLDANVGQSELGIFTKQRGMLTNDFFVNLLDMTTKWDRHRRRPHLRFELPAPGHRGSLCM